jgi:hypothetical protein
MSHSVLGGFFELEKTKSTHTPVCSPNIPTELRISTFAFELWLKHVDTCGIMWDCLEMVPIITYYIIYKTK